jgi:hypothetical protein
MLQLGDREADQSKKDFSQAQASHTLDGDLANSNRPEAYPTP